MKRKWNHPEEPVSTRSQWRSIGELEGTPEFSEWLEREFPRGAAEMEMDETSRRSFVKLMGASSALAGMGLAALSKAGASPEALRSVAESILSTLRS